MQRETRITIIVLGSFLLLLAAITAFVLLRAEYQERHTRAPAVEAVFTGQYQTLSGQAFALTSIEAPVVFVYSWATWCPQCAQQLGALAALSNEYPTSTVQIVAINRAEPSGRMERFLARRAPAAQDSNLRVLQDATDTFYQQISAYTMPAGTLYVANEVVWQSRSQLELDLIREKIAQWVTAQ